MSNNKSPRIAIVIAVLNSERLIQGVIETVLSQSYPYLNVFIVDGGSMDGSVEIIKRYEKYVSWWITEEDNGIYDAWNKALAVCDSDYIYFMGCDDRFSSPSSIEVIVQAIENSGDYPELVCGSVEMVDIRSGRRERIQARDDLLPDQMVPHQGLFHSVKLFKEFGHFNPAYKIRGDYEFLVRCLTTRKVALITVPDVIGICKTGGLSNSRMYAWTRYVETYRVRKSYKLPVITFRFAYEGIKALIKVQLYRLTG